MNIVTILLPVIIFVLALWPRWIDPDNFVTADELRWTCRSLNFRTALAAGDFSGTFQTGHPGVIQMWLARAAMPATLDASLIQACQELSPSEIAELAPWSVRAGLRDLLFAARRPLALAHALLIAAMIPLIGRLWDNRTAFLAGLLIALDPFLLALSRVLHLDALTAELMILSVLGLLIYGRSWHRGWLLAAGGLAGLATLSKAPGLFLSPFSAVWLMALTLGDQLEASRSPRRVGTDLILWHVAAGVVFWAAWPAMWVEPAGTLGGVLGQAVGYAVEAEKSTSVFLGQTVSEPGLLFYPVIWLLRTTPIILIGLLLVPLAWRQEDRRGPLLAFAVYTISFVTLLTMSEKKFDRYLLPTLLAIDLLAAVGLTSGAERIHAHLTRNHSWRWITSSGAVFSLICLVALLGQAVLVQFYHPYYLAYYNPLMGGTRRAPAWTLVGWGEGLDQVAGFLNRQPAAERLRVVGWGATLGPLFRGKVARFNPENMATADYVTLYVSDVQTGKAEAQERVGVEEPAFVARIHGLDYAWVFANSEQTAQPAWARFGEEIVLLGYELVAETVEPGDALTLTLYWQALAPPDTSYTVFTHLIDDADRIWGQHDGLPAGGERPTDQWEVGALIADRHVLPVDAAAPAGVYRLEIGLYNADTGQRLPAFDRAGQQLTLDRVLLDQVTLR